MGSDIKILVNRSKDLARQGKEREAMALANELIEQYPHEGGSWSLRGYLHSRVRNYTEAVSDFTRAIEIDGMDPYLFFSRGTDRFHLGENEMAVNDFTKALELCECLNRDDYKETLLFWRAEALLRLGKKDSALADLGLVRDGFSFWTSKLRTKAEVLADCEKLLE